MILSHSISRRRGFTLIELVISSAIASMILVAAYVCLRAGVTARKTIETRSDAYQSARVALSLMSADLRCASPLSGDFEFLGARRMVEDIPADRLDFATLNHTPRRPREGDFCELSYFVDKSSDGETFSLWRRRDTTLDLEPLEGGGREELVQSVRGLRIEYYDGFEWFEEWGDATGASKERDLAFLESNRYGMPEAVRIRIAIDPNKPAAPKTADAPSTEKGEPLVILETVARLNLAPMANSSVGGDSATSQSGVTAPGIN